MKKSYVYLMGDFETTVYDGQTRTDVWASALVELYKENVAIYGSIKETFEAMRKYTNKNIIVFYHNLKFDGAFWMNYLINEENFEQAFETGETLEDTVQLKDREMREKTFNYLISDLGQWYCIRIKIDRRIIEIRDSYKLLPFSVRDLGEAFKTNHRKLDMEYTGFRYPGCYISDKEKEYIANDVLVVKEALEIMFDEGHKGMTIGSCCLSEFTSMFDKEEYEQLFPDMYEIEIDKETYGTDNAGEYIRKSYHGGWCYLVKGKENKIFNRGITADVNSLYPSMMSSESGNRYPVGKPTFWKGNYIPKEATENERYYFVRIRTRFKIKSGKLPCIQIKQNPFYKATEWQETSDIYYPKTGKYYDTYIDIHGQEQKAIVEMTLTQTDYKLICDHYDLYEFEILDGCYFHSAICLFDQYINKYRKIKMESKGAKRTLAKLFLNNLYGKMAASRCSSFKLAEPLDDGTILYIPIEQYEKKAGYIPIGTAITSYARNFTIRAAQKNFHGADKPGFIYADTDSIHCDIEASEVKGIEIDDKEFCKWKLEATWDSAIYVRQKTYMERVIEEDLQPCEPHWEIKCAGMPQRCKDLFLTSIGCGNAIPKTADEEEFLKTKRTIKDFKVGLKVPSKLLPKQIPGGILLKETTYEMR